MVSVLVLHTKRVIWALSTRLRTYTLDASASPEVLGALLCKAAWQTQSDNVGQGNEGWHARVQFGRINPACSSMSPTPLHIMIIVKASEHVLALCAGPMNVWCTVLGRQGAAPRDQSHVPIK